MKEFTYCFIVYTKQRVIYLTSYSLRIDVGEITYLPYSGLSVREIASNDSAYDAAKIDGIWEKGGIEDGDDITGAKIEINLYYASEQIVHNLSTYFCTKMIVEGLKFTLHLESVSFRLAKTITERYSKNCRATFGDERCGIKKSAYPDNTSCDKNFITCCNKFNNAVNFRGEPFIPGSFDL